MATTNNIHKDESWPSAFKRQVQTLAAVVERFTKQNQILEEQLQRKAGHGNQEEDQEDTNAERQDPKGPEGSNAPSRLE